MMGRVIVILGMGAGAALLFRAPSPASTDDTVRVQGGERSEAAAVDWKDDLAFMAREGGVWITPNEAYQTPENPEADRYGMHYRLGLGGVSLHGCLWGVKDGQVQGVFWEFFQAWDPVEQRMLAYQSGGNGVIGWGYEAEEGHPKIDQTFVNPDGSRFRVGHDDERPDENTLVTTSFDWADSDWAPRRVYTWARQPQGTMAPC